ncbi:hypothetical protein POVWA2_070570 [Plasmodium ovale wallikeri]|uniref:PIR Superfamily Protein n=1 Tax=Plasmodium ovale wallikeri TaxID=864142 RepID=A0A1A9AJJ3_PLAOA|nr:hypothetical protein POVWA2_070570 [Plasmodium ovale wallikeri]SBT56381.1 hypothetical protein POVWA1_075720 [Plasmodium ovale wallikeri]
MGDWIFNCDAEIVNIYMENSIEIKEQFENFLIGIFSSWKHDRSSKKYKCTRDEKDYTPKMELIKKKSFFHDVISSVSSYKNDLDFHINEKCTLNKFGAKFPNVTCSEHNMIEIESDALNIRNPHGKLTELQENQLSGTNPEDSFNNSPTKIAFTSVSTILGACISGLYLHRHSFMGNMLRNSRNKNIIPQENEYADINGKFSEDPSHYIDGAENISQFYIVYNSMNH